MQDDGRDAPRRGKRRASATALVLGLSLVLAAWWLLGRGDPRGGARPNEAPRLAAAPYATPGPGVELSGWLHDSASRPLARHELLIYSTAGSSGDFTLPWLEGQATSGIDGRFVVTGLVAGTKRLDVRGAGGGDEPVLSAGPWPAGTLDLGFEPKEGSVWLLLPESGLRDLTLFGPMHALSWVKGLADYDDGESLSTTGRQAVCATLREPTVHSDRQANVPTRTRELPPLAHAVGTQIRLCAPEYVRADSRGFVAGSEDGANTELIVSAYGCADRIVPVTGSAPFVDVGTLHFIRVAGLVVKVEQPRSGPFVDEASLSVRWSGGGPPDSETHAVVRRFRLRWQDTFDALEQRLWSDRKEGQYELTVTAHGCSERTVQGVLTAGKLRIVTVELESAP